MTILISGVASSDYLYGLAVKNGLGEELPAFVEMADTPPEER